MMLCCLQVKAQGGVKHAVFNAALRYKQMWMKMGWKTTEASPLCNKVFFSKTQVRPGGWFFRPKYSATPCYACQWQVKHQPPG
jgi:hypothetical protein